MQIDIGTLTNDELAQLFYRACGFSLSIDQNVYLHQILKSVDYNTYATELLGLQIAATGCSLSTLADRVSAGLDGLNSLEKVRTKKDGHIIKRTIPEIIRILFQIANLSESRKQVLMNLYLLRFLDITKDTYRKFTYETAAGINTLNDLLELGWIRQNGNCYTLHPLVENLVRNDLKPNKNNCINVYYSVTNRIHFCCEFDDYEESAEYEYESNCNFLCAFFESVTLESESNRNLLFEWLLGIIENEYVRIGSPVDSCFTGIYRLLDKLIACKETNVYEVIKARYIILAAWVSEFSHIYCGNNEKIETQNKLREEKLVESFSLALAAAHCLPESEEGIALDGIYTLVISSALELAISDIPKNFIRKLYQERPFVFNLTVFEKEKLGLPLSEEEELEYTKFFEKNPVFKPDYTDTDIDMELTCKQQFTESDDKIGFVKQIVNDKSRVPMERAEMLWYCTDSIFEGLRWVRFPVQKLPQYDWSILEQILHLEENFLISDECNPNNQDEIQEYNMYRNDNIINQIIVYAASCNIECFENSISFLLKEYRREVEWLIHNGESWTGFLDEIAMTLNPLSKIQNALTALHKTHLILPHLIRFANGWQEYAKKQSHFDEEYLFSVFRMIADCACEAKQETNIPKEYQQDFLSMECYYRNKINKIVGADYSFKAKE